eukprot:CFRG8176T1
MSAASTFLQKLLTMLDDPKSEEFISWSASGTSFFIFDSVTFSKDILPQYFRHNKFASFVRQLNMYDFHKIPIDAARQQENENTVQFMNPYFVRGRPHLLSNMKRKAGSRVDGKLDATASEQEYITTALANLQSTGSKIVDRLGGVEADNFYLKEEFSKLCQKNEQQERTVSRIMKFLSSVYGSSGETGSALPSNSSVPHIQYNQHSSTPKCDHASLPFVPGLERMSTGFSPPQQPQPWLA